MCRLRFELSLTALLVFGSSCGLEAPAFRGLEGSEIPAGDFSDLTLEVVDETVGIFPSTSVLEDPNNPFAEDSIPLSEPSLFALDDAGPVVAFYGWATALARGSTDLGVAQYLASERLLFIAADPRFAPEEDAETLLFIAAEGFRSVLVNFPNSRLFAEDPISPPLSVANLAAQRLVEDIRPFIGLQRSRLPPGWVLIGDEAVFRVDRFRGGP